MILKIKSSKSKKTFRMLAISLALVISLLGINAVAFAATTPLGPGDTCLRDYQTLGTGARITIIASWTPNAPNLVVGIYNRDTGTLVNSRTLSGGSGRVTFTIPATARYAIYLRNPSTGANDRITVTTSYYVNN